MSGMATPLGEACWWMPSYHIQSIEKCSLKNKLFTHFTNLSPGTQRTAFFVPRLCFRNEKLVVGIEEDSATFLPLTQNIQIWDRQHLYPTHTMSKSPYFPLLSPKMMDQNILKAIDKSFHGFAKLLPSTAEATFCLASQYLSTRIRVRWWSVDSHAPVCIQVSKTCGPQICCVTICIHRTPVQFGWFKSSQNTQGDNELHFRHTGGNLGGRRRQGNGCKKESKLKGQDQQTDPNRMTAALIYWICNTYGQKRHSYSYHKTRDRWKGMQPDSPQQVTHSQKKWCDKGRETILRWNRCWFYGVKISLCKLIKLLVEEQ